MAPKKPADPYLLSDAELAGRDFSGPYFYPRDRKIVKKARKEWAEEEKEAYIEEGGGDLVWLETIYRKMKRR